MHARSIACLTLTALAAAACGDAPRPVDPVVGRPLAPAGMPAGHSADDGHDHGAPAPAGPVWSGEIVLRGPRAESDEGVLMVSLVSTGQRMPRMTYRISLSGQPPAIDGERRIPFLLNERNDMLPGPLPPELQGTPLSISVRYDKDGVVETSEGDVTVAAPVGWGGEGLEIVVGS
ncbi:MAG TPA: hypothetical protein VMT18_01220 [Planctomycetota bacterium]|nr:hypothetical protein [Planctomycetota bacterium]